MATTRKSTKKTSAAARTKQPAVRAKTTKVTKTTAKATTAKKTTAKKAAVKSTKNASAKVTAKTVKKTEVKTTKTRSMFESLRIWNFVLAGVHALLAVLIVVLGKTVQLPVTTFHTTTDSLASLGGNEVYAHATRTLFDVNLAYLIAGFFAVAALMHLSVATWYRKKYESQFNDGVSKARAVGFALTIGLVTIAVSLLIGLSDKTTLALIFGATALMVFSGLAVELQAKRGVRPERLTKLIGLVSGLAPLVAIGWYLFATNRYGDVVFKNYVYVLAGTLAVMFVAYMYMQIKAARKSGSFADYLTVEYSYMIWLAVLCVAVSAQTYAAVLR